MKIPFHIILFLKLDQNEVVISAIKWVGFFCDHVSDFSFPDILSLSLTTFFETPANGWILYRQTLLDLLGLVISCLFRWEEISMKDCSLVISCLFRWEGISINDCSLVISCLFRWEEILINDCSLVISSLFRWEEISMKDCSLVISCLFRWEEISIKDSSLVISGLFSLMSKMFKNFFFLNHRNQSFMNLHSWKPALNVCEWWKWD